MVDFIFPRLTPLAAMSLPSMCTSTTEEFGSLVLCFRVLQNKFSGWECSRVVVHRMYAAVRKIANLYRLSGQQNDVPGSLR